MENWVPTFKDNLEKKSETFLSLAKTEDSMYPKGLGNITKTCSRLLLSFHKQKVIQRFELTAASSNKTGWR